MELKWYKEYLEKISKMTNEEVWDEYEDLAGGDDWDGEFTRRGLKKFQAIHSELRKRLTAIGFFAK